MYNNAGTGENANLILASKILVVNLKDGDVLSLSKANTIHRMSPNSGVDKRITFCICLR